MAIKNSVNKFNRRRFLQVTSAGIIASVLLPSCTQAQKTSTDAKQLIVYLSRTKNTKAVAEIIQQYTAADLAAIELVNPYPANYRQIVEQVARENETGFLPALKTKIENLEKYNTVFIGFPTWGMKLPPPVKTFLTQNNLAAKKIVPFNSNAGYGVGSSFKSVRSLCSKSNVLKGFQTQGGIERDGVLFVMEGNKKTQVENEVTAWLKGLGLI